MVWSATACACMHLSVVYNVKGERFLPSWSPHLSLMEKLNNKKTLPILLAIFWVSTAHVQLEVPIILVHKNPV